jgi:M6 family metalloprotease-like protein
MKKVILLIILMLISIILNAAWLNDFKKQIKQPDGTVVDVFSSGDEYYNWTHDKEQHTIVFDDKTGYWCWAIIKDDILISSGFPIHQFTPSEANVYPKINISEDKYKQIREEILSTNPNSQTRTPSVGNCMNLVIFIKFADDPDFSNTIVFYDNLFNTVGTNVSSLKQYMIDASYNQLNVVSPYYPLPSSNVIVPYIDSYDRGYYQPRTSTNTIGYSSYSSRTSREHSLLGAAIEYVATQIPSSVNLDYDNDEYIDNINFIIKGRTDDWSELLWPHRWSMPYRTYRINGIWANDYNFNIENHLQQYGVSVLCHEFTHSLGAPDLYRYYEAGNPVGQWCLMASNTTPPQAISSFVKYKYIHWINQIPLITNSGQYSLSPNTTSQNGHSLRIASPYNNYEYFIVEYRKTNTGLIDSAIPGSGLLVWRINPLAGDGNAVGPPDEIYVYRPNGTPTTQGSVNSANYSLETDRTAINDITNPRSFLSNGGQGGLNIYNIGSAAGETITFNVNVVGADPNVIDESFESQNFNAFDWMHSGIHWTISNVGAANGNYCAASPILSYGEVARLETSMQFDNGFLHFMVKPSCYSNVAYLRFYINDELISQWTGINSWQFFSTMILTGEYKLTWEFHRGNSGSAGDNRAYIDSIGFPPILGQVPYTPKNLIVYADDRDVHLQWDPPYISVLETASTITGYKIYQNSRLINTIPTPNLYYVVENVSGGNLIYSVSTVYDNIDESERSDTQNITVLPLATVQNLTYQNELGGIRLSWEFHANTVSLSGFRIYRNLQLLTNPSLTSSTYSFLDRNIEEGEEYMYYVIAVYQNPSGLSQPSNSVTAQGFTSEDDLTIKNDLYVLKNNYPNPFNPETNIEYNLNKDSNVKIQVFNIKGELVKTLVNSFKEQGNYSIIFDGKDDFGNSISSGLYFYKMTSDSFVTTKKMILLK